MRLRAAFVNGVFYVYIKVHIFVCALVHVHFLNSICYHYASALTYIISFGCIYVTLSVLLSYKKQKQIDTDMNERLAEINRAASMITELLLRKLTRW